MPSLRDVTLQLDFPELPLHLEAMAEDKGGPPHAAVYLPADYDADTPQRCLIWIQGGKGGDAMHAGSGRAIVGDEGWVVINLPLFKREIDPLDEEERNKWHRLYLSSDEGEHIWRCYAPMLTRIKELVPNLRPELTCMGGFSNGAHSTVNLLNRDQPITDWAHHFCLVEGGNELERADRIPGRLIILQGDGWEGDHRDWLVPVAAHAREAGAACRFERMAEVGHAFPPPWQARLADWLRAWI